MRRSIISTLAVFTAVYAAKISLNAQCGNGVTCQGSVFGNCCSRSGWCGVGATYCGTGCQSAYGTCDSTSGANPSTATGSVQKITDTGGCGKDHQSMTCTGSVFGNCCSLFGYCGSLDVYCGYGCQDKFGTCRSTAVNTKVISPNARCGKLAGAAGGFTCKNSIWGNCCSDQSYCGSTDAYCGKGCQSEFGDCSRASSPSPTLTSASSTTSSTSSTTSSLSSTSSSSSSSSSLEPVTVSPTLLTSSAKSPATSSSSSTLSPSFDDEPVTVTPTPLTSSTTPSATSSSSDTSTPSSTQPPCFRPTSNYFQNPSLEYGNSVRPFTVSASSTNWELRYIRSAAQAHSGTYSVRVHGNSDHTSTVEVVQTNVMIPSGTTVTGSAWVAPALGSYVSTLSMTVDGVNIGTPYTTPTTRGWTQFGGGELTVSGDTHVIGVRIAVTYPNPADVLDLDDFLLTVVRPPPGSVNCS